ncbi:adenosylcobinamide-GDP ribazoletransferase [Lysobacter auxotrophicus]|uniref:Adenosylcobinamide-GDP ribazoletransferase n=2 Tax=Lysobacter auxotrophicus TaxID=2992573 RepID=A0ABM8DAI3_9GAMM|nr:adenosylcobinamide-GDP ribazoletransferase [Lysobacter auxotrophicus]
MRGLLVAVGFLTRIPVPSCVYADARARSQSLAWYPLVGALIGAMLCALLWLAPGDKPLLVAAMPLVAWVSITGALHLDGLADSADAWVGGMGGSWDERRTRTLDIMKDPRCGPAGVTALVLVLLAKFAALASLGPDAWRWLWLPPLLARMAATTAFVGTPYVRAGGLGTEIAGASRIACTIALSLGVAACAWAGARGAVAVAIAAIVFLLWRRACMRRLGGITGDTAGALVELVETAVLVGVALFPPA